MDLLYDPGHAEAVKPFFDPSYYLATNPDVRANGIDPLTHFLTCGWQEGRNPSVDFDVNYYLRVNTDVAARKLNPLVHYAWSGAREGRLPRRPLDSIRRYVERSTPPRVRAADWGGAVDRSSNLDHADLARCLAPSFERVVGVVISVSHDDYESSLGGVQNVIRHERTGFEQMGHAYLHLSPAAPLPMLADAHLHGFRFRMRIGDRFLGTATVETLTACLAEFTSAGTVLRLVVHHCMGHAPERLLDIAALCVQRPIFWAHDFFALCTAHDLLRNDVQYCGAPPDGSPACTICIHGSERGEHLRRMRSFISALDPIVLAPSHAALDFWRTHDAGGSDVCVQKLARLVSSDDDPPQRQGAEDGLLRIAHIGMRRLSKGWPVFEDLATRFSNTGSYAFYQFGIEYGAQGPAPGCIRRVDVRVSREDPDSMIEALAEHRIDVVVNWSLWPETFCFAAYEALAAGTFLLARADAGNVSRIVELAPEQGQCVRDQAALFQLFESGDVKRLAMAAPLRRGVLIPEYGAAAWLRRNRHGTADKRLVNAERPVAANV